VKVTFQRSHQTLIKKKAVTMVGMTMLAIFQAAGSLRLSRFAGIAFGSWS